MIRVRIERYPLSRIYVAMALPVGIFLVFAQPPGQGLDEVPHFYRLWTLAHGTLFAHHGPGGYGTVVPRCVVDYLQHFATKASQPGPFSISDYWRTPGACSGSEFAPFTNTAVYNPVAYFPALVATVPLIIAHAPLPLIFFAGRLSTLLAYIAVFCVAVRVAPLGKQVLFVLALLPTSLLLAASISEDPLTISFAVLSVALLLRSLRSRGEDRRVCFCLWLCLLVVALAKPTYFIFALLLLAVPNHVLGNVRHPMLAKLGATTIVLALAAPWWLAVRNVQAAPVPLYGLRPHTQTEFILHHPFSYLAVLARTLFYSSGEIRWLPGFFFSVGYIRPHVGDSIYAPTGLVVIGALTLWYAFGLQLGVPRRLQDGSLAIGLPIVLTVLGVVLVETALFVYGTPAGLPESAVQGRYFLPLVPLPLVTIAVLREPRTTRSSILWLLLGTMLMLLWLIAKICLHDY